MTKSPFTKDELVGLLKKIINQSQDLDVSGIISSLKDVLPGNKEFIGNSKCPTLPAEQLKKEMAIIYKTLADFLVIHDENLTRDDVDINERNLAEVITRKHKRQEYYRYFHNMGTLSELKEVALLAFWLIKLKPFTVLKEESKLRVSFNESFSIYLIYSMIRYLTEHKEKEFKMPQDSFLKDLLYTLRFRDMSKEAMILLVDSLANSYGINIDSWL